MNYKKLAEDILQNVGGTGNVAGLTHCATRLRFNLKEESRAKTEVIKKLKGVMGVVSSGDQYQIIIGSDVESVFKEVQALGNFSDSTDAKEKDGRSLWQLQLMRKS